MGKSLTMFKAYETFIRYKRSAGLSRYTVRNYGNTLKKLRMYWDEDLVFAEVEDLSAEDGWALVYAARPLAAAPDPDFWQRTLP